nr:MAG TPA: hypothetical protein [Caudoviricetes sp.]
MLGSGISPANLIWRFFAQSSGSPHMHLFSHKS